MVPYQQNHQANENAQQGVFSEICTFVMPEALYSQGIPWTYIGVVCPSRQCFRTLSNVHLFHNAFSFSMLTLPNVRQA